MTVVAIALYYQLGGPQSRIDPLRVIEGMAAAIGIIAAGLIIVRGGEVRNLTTAAHIWLTAGIGLASGAGYFAVEIGRAHVCTPVPNAPIVCRLLLEKKTNTQSSHI